MPQLKTIVFSKDRPLQLQAYLESYQHFTKLDYKQVYVIIPKLDEHYSLLAKKFDVNWLIEENFGGFDATLREFTSTLKDDDLLLFGCDDVVYIRTVDVGSACDLLEADKELLGFSLRLGKNIIPRPIAAKETEAYYYWNWVNLPGHYGYPFEVMASIYRAPLFKEIVNGYKQTISPNHLESSGVNHCYFFELWKTYPYMAMFNGKGNAIAFDVNRVQNYFQNKFTGTVEQDPQYLKDKFMEGKRLDWGRACGITPTDCFVGNKYFNLV